MHLQDGLYFQLLLILDRDSRARNALGFKLREREFEMGPQDFTLVTGLRFSPVPPARSISAFHNIVFCGRPDIQKDEIHEEFIKRCAARGGGGEYCYKLALLYLIYSVIVCPNQHSPLIDVSYVHVVDDLEAFENYPWGRVAYDQLIESTHADRACLDHYQSSSIKRTKVDAHGYSYALQVWAYEMIPLVSQLCARKVLGWETKTPRVVRWIPILDISRSQIKTTFESPNVVVRAFMLPVSTETLAMNTMYSPRGPIRGVSGVTSYGSPPDQFHTGLNHAKRKLAFDGPIVGRAAHSEAKSKPLLPRFDIGQLLTILCMEGSRVSTCNERVIYKSPAPAAVRSPSVLPVQSRSPFRRWVAQVSIVKDSLSSLRNMVHSVEIKGNDLSLQKDTSSLPQRAHINVLDSSSSESCFSRGLTVKNSTKSGPLCLQQDSDDDGISSSTRIIVPTKLTVGVERMWFDEILDPVGWLLDEHLDALLALVVETFTKAGHATPEAREYTVLDTTCWITIFDSMSESSYWPSMIYELTDFTFNIPYLLRRANIQLTADGVECQTKTMWELVQYRHPSQQRNKSDCSIMAVKYIESLLGGTPFASIRPESAHIYRKNYCARLFECGMQSRGAVRGRVG
ncbi:hypothetical protein C2S52_008517 [Perilla frutescens var. hirtella]|nr:hypothetical protein C2S52_008517 [Perilla frutescens var. hirtella]